MVTIVQKGEPVLRTRAKEVNLLEISSNKIRDLLRSMQETLQRCEEGVALAAPQIGEPLRIFVVDARTWKGAAPEHEPLIYINPQLVKQSKTKKEMDEGCLSVTGMYGKTQRATRATVEAYNENGKKFTRGASGLLAQIFQHEIDHLNGILFVDHAKDLVKVEQKQNQVQ